MLLLRALKIAVYNKLDGTDFTDNLEYFTYTHVPLNSTTDEDYPHAYYRFGTEDDILTMEDNVPVGADILLGFHIFTLGTDGSGDPKTSTDLENLMENLVDEFTNSDDKAILDINSAGVSDNWANPSFGLVNQQIIPEPETNNWHGMIQFSGVVGR